MQNSTPPFTPKSFLRISTIIHLALVAGVLIFGIVMFSIRQNQKLELSYTGDIMFFLVPILAIAGILVGNYQYANTMKVLASKNTLREKLAGFQTASIVKYAMLEGPALLGLVSFMNEGNQYFLIISILLALWLLMQKPTRDKIERDLMLEGTLKNQFTQEDAPMA